jgi:hypothetical protein
VKGMKNLYLLCTLIISFTVCITKTVKQGITGKIYVRKGNYMPSPGQPQSMGRPLSTVVEVYELTNKEQANSTDGIIFDHIRTKFVAKVLSDADGSYTIDLPAGSYSVFTNYNGLLYANNLDDKGNINAIVVKKNCLSVRDMIISIQAVY